jgi:2-haloacid dehalogenase
MLPSTVAEGVRTRAVHENSRSIVIFDLGGVLIRWNPRFLYRKLFDDEAAMEKFLAEVCTSEWNERQDAGRSFADGVIELLAIHPEKEHLIRAFGDRFDEMIPGALDEVVEILVRLKHRGTPLYALTNWSAETFETQPRRFAFLELFDGIVVSGREELIKPDERIFRVLLDRYSIDPAKAVFIDDAAENAQAASRLGIHGIHFEGAPSLLATLQSFGFL